MVVDESGGVYDEGFYYSIGNVLISIIIDEINVLLSVIRLRFYRK